jgi:hypothetical protein
MELLKVIVQPVVLERDEDGVIIGEKLGEPTPLYTLDQITEFVQMVREQLVAENATTKEETE